MSDRLISRAAGTIAGVLTDLHQVNGDLAAGRIKDEPETTTTAELLDRLAAELSEAAANIRGEEDAGVTVHPGGGWISGPMISEERQ